MSPYKNKLSLKTFGEVYSFKYDFKCHYSTIAPITLENLIIFVNLNLN